MMMMMMMMIVIILLNHLAAINAMNEEADYYNQKNFHHHHLRRSLPTTTAAATTTMITLIQEQQHNTEEGKEKEEVIIDIQFSHNHNNNNNSNNKDHIDGSIPVTFRVDMTGFEVNPDDDDGNGIYIFGDLNDWNFDPMNMTSSDDQQLISSHDDDDDDDEHEQQQHNNSSNIWDITLLLQRGNHTYQYKFFNGTKSWDDGEYVYGPCAAHTSGMRSITIIAIPSSADSADSADADDNDDNSTDDDNDDNSTNDDDILQKLVVLPIVPWNYCSDMSLFEKEIEEEEDPTSTIIKVACIGDSITQGSGYPLELQNLFNNNNDNNADGNYDHSNNKNNFFVYNFGNSGKTLSRNVNINNEFDGSLSDSYWDQIEFDLSHDIYMPDIVIIMLGTNDSKKPSTIWSTTKEHNSFEDDMKALYNSYINLQESNHPPDIYFVTPPIAYEPNNFDVDNDIIETSIIPIIENVTKQIGINLIDMHQYTKDSMSSRELFFPDGVHPNNDGAMLIAQKIYSILSLKKPILLELNRDDDELQLRAIIIDINITTIPVVPCDNNNATSSWIIDDDYSPHYYFRWYQNDNLIATTTEGILDLNLTKTHHNNTISSSSSGGHHHPTTTSSSSYKVAIKPYANSNDWIVSETVIV